MPSINEFIQSPVIRADRKNSTAEFTYNILGTEDEAAAMSLLLGEAPVNITVDGFLLSHQVLEVKHSSFNHWIGTCRLSRKAMEEPLYQFETGGGSTHITHSISTVQRRIVGGGTAPNFGGAIGWDGQRINGCDIISPVFSFSETHSFDSAFVDGAYRLALFRATGKTNNAAFKGFEAGEVLFLGASGTKRGDDRWEISYRFAASENVTGLTVGGITGINKKGWEYLWVYFAEDTSQSVLVKTPLVSHVEQVYHSHNFANIGIGT